MLQFIFYKTIITTIIGGSVGLIFLIVFGIARKCFSSNLKYYTLLIPLILMLIPISFGIKIQTVTPETTGISQAVKELDPMPKSEVKTDSETIQLEQLPIEG